MATVGGGYFVSDALTYGMPDVATQQFYQDRISSLQNTGHNFGFTQDLLNTATQIVSSIDVTNIIDRARAVINKIDSFLRPNVVSELTSLQDFQVAGSVMQRWVMANPVVRERYQESRLDGYSDSYIDTYPKTLAEDHNDYRMVMTGIVQIDDKGTTYTVDYYQNLDEPEELSSSEKFDILSSWRNIENILAEEDKDPTSPWGDSL